MITQLASWFRTTKTVINIDKHLCFIAGGLPVHVLRAGGLHHQQRHHHPQPRGPRAVEERVPAQRVRAGEQGVHGYGGGHRDQGLGRHGHDRQLQVRGVCKCLQQLI